VLISIIFLIASYIQNTFRRIVAGALLIVGVKILFQEHLRIAEKIQTDKAVDIQT